jgi:MFS family permease
MGMMVNGTSVFLIPLNEAFGWDRGAVSLINFYGLLGLAFGGIVMGRIADRASVRHITLFGATVLGLCILAASRANQLWQFYILFFLGGFFGAASLFTPLITNVGVWFKRGVGVAIGIASAGQALGQGLVPYGLAILIGLMGWRDALTTMGGVMLLVLIPLALLIRRPAAHEQPKSLAGDPIPDQPTVPLSPTLVTIWMSAAVLFCCFCMSVPLMHLVPLIQDRGFSLEEAGSVVFIMLLVAIVGRIAFGRLADMVGAVRAYWIASCWQTVLILFFLQMETLNGFYIFAMIYGFGYAGVMTTLLVCVRVMVPVSRRASSLGFVMMFAYLGHAIGGYQGGFFFDWTGNYSLSYTNAALAGVVNLIIVGALYITINRRRLTQPLTATVAS